MAASISASTAVRLLVLIFLGLGCLCGASSSASPRIIGGYTTTISSVPYIVYLRRSGSFICGGALIHKRFVATAAHCVYGYSASVFEVVGGASYLNSGGVSRKVNLIILPSSYNPNTQHMDVAVLRLAADMTGSNIQIIPVCSVVVPVGATVKISGWGLTSENGSTSNQVRSIDVPVISKTKCQTAYNRYVKLTASMMCASESGVKDSCKGDSGGPLVYKKQLCGIVSWGIGCARSDFPGVYTDAYKVRTFLSNAVAKHSK